MTMTYLARLYKQDLFKEGVLVGLFFVITSLLLYVIYRFFPTIWLVIFSILALALGGVIFFMSIFIPFSSKKGGEIFLFIWNEFLYVFLGIPLASICILILPITIYLLFFSGSIVWLGFFSAIVTIVLMLSSLIYSGFKIWLNQRTSGLPVPEKAEKEPIEVLLYRRSFSED